MSADGDRRAGMREELDAYHTTAVTSAGPKHESGKGEECGFKASEPPVEAPEGTATPVAVFQRGGGTRG